jgi:hypothetical protein
MSPCRQRHHGLGLGLGLPGARWAGVAEVVAAAAAATQGLELVHFSA